MRARYWSMLSLTLLVGLVPLIAQDEEEDPHTGFPPSTRMESRQGYPDHADVNSHRHMVKDAHAKCISVQDHPGQAGEGENAACLLRYDTGEKYRLNFKKSIRFPKDGEVYLECLGNKPTRCVIGLW
jgi:hypothetical protein